MAWLRRRTADPRRRAWTERRIELLRVLATEPWLTFDEVGSRLGVTRKRVWQLVQRCVRDGLVEETRSVVDGRPSRRAGYRITPAARAVVMRGVDGSVARA